MRYLILVLGLVGCATASGMKSEPLTAGDARTFKGDYQVVLRATRTAVSGIGLAIESFSEPTPTTGVIVAKKGTTAFSYGELVRVVVQGNTDSTATVRVLTKRKLATNVTAKGNYSESIFSSLDLALR